MKRSIAKLRVEYGNTPLLEEDLKHDPLDQFRKWLEESINAHVMEPNGMILSTVSELGRPSSRAVLLKEIDPKGFVFFTHYQSRKGRQLAHSPFASATFWWKEIYRQVNVEGYVVKIPRKASQDYFYQRPRGAQAAAVVSFQSEPLSSRALLEDQYSLTCDHYKGKQVPCPKEWGGYCLIPERFEFWQGRESRLHDRFLYVLIEKKWVFSRLYP